MTVNRITVCISSPSLNYLLAHAGFFFLFLLLFFQITQQIFIKSAGAISSCFSCQEGGEAFNPRNKSEPQHFSVPAFHPALPLSLLLPAC